MEHMCFFFISSPNPTKMTLKETKHLGAGVPHDFDEVFLWLHPSQHFPNLMHFFFCHNFYAISVYQVIIYAFSLNQLIILLSYIYFRRKVCITSVDKSNCTHKHHKNKARLLTCRDTAIC